MCSKACVEARQLGIILTFCEDDVKIERKRCAVVMISNIDYNLILNTCGKLFRCLLFYYKLWHLDRLFLNWLVESEEHCQFGMLRLSCSHKLLHGLLKQACCAMLRMNVS